MRYKDYTVVFEVKIMLERAVSVSLSLRKRTDRVFLHISAGPQLLYFLEAVNSPAVFSELINIMYEIIDFYNKEECTFVTNIQFSNHFKEFMAIRASKLDGIKMKEARLYESY